MKATILGMLLFMFNINVSIACTCPAGPYLCICPGAPSPNDPNPPTPTFLENFTLITGHQPNIEEIYWLYTTSTMDITRFSQTTKIQVPIKYDFKPVATDSGFRHQFSSHSMMNKD